MLSSLTGSITVGNKTYNDLGGTDLLLSMYYPDGKLGWVQRTGGPGNEQVGSLSLHQSNSYQTLSSLTGSVVPFHLTTYSFLDGHLGELKTGFSCSQQSASTH